jgi:phospholipid N-methyltransferase
VFDSNERPAAGVLRDWAERPGEERLAFFREFLRRPDEIGSIIPSSHHLERRLVAAGDVANAPTVVELGPGTGGTTRAVLRALRRDARLFAVEINPHFASRLRAIADPRLTVHLGSAVDLRAILGLHGLAHVDLVLSGIPFSTMPPGIGHRIIRAIAQSLAPGGRFVAYQLRGAVGAMGRDVMGPPRVEFVLRNVPPMRIYTWRAPREPQRR